MAFSASALLTASLVRRDVDEPVYAEAKTVMAHDPERARALFRHAPNKEKSRRYVEKIERYVALCSDGAIERPITKELRDALGAVLPHAPSHRVARYAEALHAAGYGANALGAVTLSSAAAAMDAAGMLEGDRVLFDAFVDARTPCIERVFEHLLRAANRCAGLSQCVRTVVDAQKKETTGEKQTTGKNETTDDARTEGVGTTVDDDETAGDD